MARVFVPGKPFHLNLIYESKARACQSECRLLALLTKVRVGKKVTKIRF
jgi:hypothetical protein